MSFETIHEDICGMLEKDAFLLKNKVGVFQQDKGDIAKTISIEIGKLGICAVVSTPSAKAESTDSRNVSAMADVLVRVIERPTLNRIRANACSAGVAARHIATALNLENTKGGDCIVFKEISSAALEGGDVVYDVLFIARTTLRKTT